MMSKVTYIVVPVAQDKEGWWHIDMNDDGEPGPWGDTYTVDENEKDEWVHDPDAQALAYHLVNNLVAK